MTHIRGATFFLPPTFLCGAETATSILSGQRQVVALSHYHTSWTWKEDPWRSCQLETHTFFVYKRQASRETGRGDCRQLLVMNVEKSNNLPGGSLLSWSYDIAGYNAVPFPILKQGMLPVFIARELAWMDSSSPSVVQWGHEDEVDDDADSPKPGGTAYILGFVRGNVLLSWFCALQSRQVASSAEHHATCNLQQKEYTLRA
jgi:hypothetical protein